jgi:hypothetical protein
VNCSFVDSIGQPCDNAAHFEVTTELGTEPYGVCRAHTWEALRTMAGPGQAGIRSIVTYVGPDRLPQPFVDFEWEER